MVYMLTTISVSVLQLKVFLHFLPTGVVGLWLLFLSMAGYVLFFDLGISPTVAREISFALARPNEQESERNRSIGELLSTMRFVFRISSSAIGILGFVIGELLIRNSVQFSHSSQAYWAWALFSAGAAINLLGSPAFAALFGIGSVSADKLIRSLCLVIGFCLTVTALELHMGLIGLSAVWCIQAILVQVLAWRKLKFEYPQFFLQRYAHNWKVARRLASPCFSLALLQLGALLILQTSTVLIAALLGTSAIPPYEAVSKIAYALMMLAMLIVNSSSPFLSMAHAAGEDQKFGDLLFYNLRLGLALAAMLVGFVAVNGDRIISVWIGSSLFAGWPVVWLLLLTTFLEIHHVVFGTAVLASGRVAFVYTALIAGILNIGFAIALTGHLKLLGIVVALAAAQLLTNNWYVPFYAVRLFKISVSRLAREVWIPILALLALQIGLDLLERRIPWLASGRLITIVASFLISALAGGALAAAIVLKSPERRFLAGQLLNFRRLGAQRG